MVWEWLTNDVSRWITVDLWGLIADHPWWTAFIAIGALAALILLAKLLSFLFGAGTYAYVGNDEDYAAAAPLSEAVDPDVLTRGGWEVLETSAWTSPPVTTTTGC